MAKTRYLPMFPLRLVVFPGEQLNLHIFEPRYKQLILECEKDGITFGIPAYIDGKLMEVGTEIRLKSIENRQANGEMDIKTEGISLFKIKEFYTQTVGKMYGAADIVDLKTERTYGSYLKNEQILELTIELFGYLKVQKKLPDNTQDFQCFDIAHYVGFTIEQEYAFLCIPNEAERQDYMLEHLNRLLPVVKEMELLRQKAQLNGHFKNIVPPKL